MGTKFWVFLIALLMLKGISVHAQVDNQTLRLTRGTSAIGDVNGDGKIDVADVVTLVNLIMKNDGSSENPDVASSQLITGIDLQETLDCVVGTINLPGFNPAYLAAYVGENKTGLPEFPISGSDYNVLPNGNYLIAKELPLDDDQFVGNSGKMSYLINGVGNAGKLYFTITPRITDPSLFQFDLLNSTDELGPFKLSNIAKSDHLLRFNFGSTPTNVESENTSLYEADATIDFKGIEKIHFDWTKFGYNNLWDAGAYLTPESQTADPGATNMYGRYQYLIGMIKSQSGVKNVLQSTLKIIEDFYNGVYSSREKLQKQRIRASWDDGKYSCFSGLDITSVFINPLNFKQLFSLNDANMPWSFNNYDKALGDLTKTIQTNASGATSVSLKSVSMDGTQPKMTFSTGNADVVIDISSELYDAINNGMELASLESEVNLILQPYQTISGTSSNEMSRVSSYLDKRSASAMTEKGGNVAWNGVEPILLFENMLGIGQFHSNMTINGSDAVTFVMTSLTEEYMVPAYMKYIAIIQNGNVVESYTYEGKEKLAHLSLPLGESEIVYQVSDFYGNIVTNRYSVNRNQ